MQNTRQAGHDPTMASDQYDLLTTRTRKDSVTVQRQSKLRRRDDTSLCRLKEVHSAACSAALVSSLQTSYRHPAGAALAGRDANRAAAAILLKHNVNFLHCGDSPVRHGPRLLRLTHLYQWIYQHNSKWKKQKMDLWGISGSASPWLTGPLRGLIVGPSGWAASETEITFMAPLHRPTGANPETIVLTGMSQNKRLMS